MDVRHLARDRLLEMVKAVNPPGGWKILVIDAVTTRIISSACSMYDIMEEGVSMVEGLEKKRQPMRKEALYFLRPCPETIDILNEDFKEKAEPQYKNAHLFFTSRVSDALFKRISDNTKMRTKTFVEVNLEYLAVESKIFHLDMEYPLYSIRQRPSKSKTEAIATQILTFFVSINENPFVRFCASSTHSRVIAEKVNRKLSEYSDQNQNFPNGEDDKTRGTLLVVDRFCDLTFPVMHDFGLQAASYDVLGLDETGDTFTYSFTDRAGDEQEKSVHLTDSDPIWARLRHLSVDTAIRVVDEERVRFLKENEKVEDIPIASLEGKKAQSLREMSEAIQAMPKYQRQKDAIATHVRLVNDCHDGLLNYGLKDTVHCEQSMVLREDVSGNILTDRDSLAYCRSILQSEKLRPIDKLRVAIVLFLSCDVSERDRGEIVALCDYEGSSEILSRAIQLKQFNAMSKQSRNNAQSKVPQSNRKRKCSKVSVTSAAQSTLETYESRHDGFVAAIMESLAKGSCEEEEWPYVGDKPKQRLAVATEKRENRSVKSMRRSKSTVPTKEEKDALLRDGASVDAFLSRKQDFDDRILVVFVLGGVSRNEMRMAYHIGQSCGREILLGSTNILSAKQFVSYFKRGGDTDL